MIQLPAKARKFLLPGIHDEDGIRQWKLNAYYRTVLLGLIPITIIPVLCLAFLSQWRLSAMIILMEFVFILSCALARRKHLELAINSTVIGATITVFFYLIYVNNDDPLYFMVFMIIISGIFLGTKAAFIWAFIQSALLVLVAIHLHGYTIFPDTRNYFSTAGNALPGRYFSTIILLYFSCAFLSILFQRYFFDLLHEVKKMADDTILLESQLFQSQKLESMGMLAGGIAHNFNHGLTTIQSSANLILKKVGDSDEDLRKYARNIYATCRIIGESTGKLLGFARRSKSEMTTIDVHEVVDGIVNLMQYQLDKNILIATDLKAQQYMVRGDFPQLQNVLMNLSINAKDAMPDGGELTFSTWNPASDPATDSMLQQPANSHEYIALRIKDTGSGMDNTTLANLFKPFFTTKQNGTGLGLSIVDRIIKNHNGVLNVTSEIGKGSSFTIYLPLAKKP